MSFCEFNDIFGAGPPPYYVTYALTGQQTINIDGNLDEPACKLFRILEQVFHRFLGKGKKLAGLSRTLVEFNIVTCGYHYGNICRYLW
jgi:hypothetical protein